MALFIGIAGWSIPKQYADRFAASGSHLERYASRFNAVEVNSSFYRSHQPKTYARWAASVPAEFRFAVKVPREITHECCLIDTESHLDRFLDEASQLGDKLGPLLVQLPPSLAMEDPVAEQFFCLLRHRFTGAVVFEPRHRSWFAPTADRLLTRFRISRVAADPAVIPAAADSGGSADLRYFRLHGSPRMYYSAYDGDFLDDLAKRLRPATEVAPSWCIFDNTALGAAIENALDLQKRLRHLTPNL